MKKVLFALCALSLLTLGACKKENVAPDTPGANPGGNTPGVNEDQIPDGEGYYKPGAKIAELQSDGETVELWNWEDGLLTAIQAPDSNGNMADASVFTYKSKRLATATTAMMDMPMQANYAYQGSQLASVSAAVGPMQAANIAFGHNANGKISNVTVTVNEQLLGMLSNLLGSGLLDGIDFGNFFGKGAQQKLAFTSSNIAVDMEWQGDNVSRQRVAVDINGSVTLGEIRQMVNLDSLLGGMAAMLALIPDSTQMPLSIAMRDTMDMTYDSHPNPYCGFLGRLEPAALSANNMLSSHNAMSATVTLTLATSFGNFPIPMPLPLSEPEDETYTYTYNAAGYPETVTDGNGDVTRIIYQQ